MGARASFLFSIASEKKYRSIQLIALSAFILLILNKILQHGFFMDGGLYLSVSKNYARGLGTFWHPHFSKTQFDYFTEQPPLYFFVMHLFYKFLGMGFFAERIFALVCVFFTSLMIHLCWVLLTDKPRASAFPLLLFIITPVIFWAYSNFVEEILMTGFVLVSVYASLHIFRREQKVEFWIVVAAGASVLAFLTKGIQGCFALATLPCMAIAHDLRKSGRNFLYSFYVFLVFALLLLLLALLFPHSVIFFTDYANNRLEKAFVSEVHKTTGNHLYLAEHLFMELLPAGILCLLLWLAARKKTGFGRLALGMFLIGICGSFPLMLTTEQRGFYLVTSLPYFMLSMALMVLPSLDFFLEKTGAKSLRVSSLLLLAATVGWMSLNIGNWQCDRILMRDVKRMSSLFSYGDIVGLDPSLKAGYTLKNYLILEKYISCDESDPRSRKYIIWRREIPPADSSGLIRLNMYMPEFILYRNMYAGGLKGAQKK
jgi:hypothetical protein